MNCSSVRHYKKLFRLHRSHRCSRSRHHTAKRMVCTDRSDNGIRSHSILLSCNFSHRICEVGESKLKIILCRSTKNANSVFSLVSLTRQCNLYHHHRSKLSVCTLLSIHIGILQQGKIFQDNLVRRYRWDSQRYCHTYQQRKFHKGKLQSQFQRVILID